MLCGKVGPGGSESADAPVVAFLEHAHPEVDRGPPPRKIRGAAEHRADLVRGGVDPPRGDEMTVVGRQTWVPATDDQSRFDDRRGRSSLGGFGS